MTSIVNGATFSSTVVIAYPNGGRLAYSTVHGLIAFDQAINLQWEIRTCDADGNNLTTLTVGLDGLPDGHRGNPSWSPGGAWIVFQACTFQDELAGPGFGTPGLGLGNDIYIMSYPGLVVTKLTDIVDGSGGVLHPHFNHDGTELWWAQKETGGDNRWFIVKADFTSVGGVPTLSNTTYYKPRGNGLYETHPLGSSYALFSHSSAGTSTEPGLNVYRVAASDLTSNPVTIEGATAGGADQYWHEHGHPNPAVTHILYMTSRLTGVEDPWGGDLLTDVLKVNNSDPTVEGTQITDFDNPASGTYQGDVTQPIAGDMAFIDEDTLLVYCFDGPPTAAEYAGTTTRPGKILKIVATS